MRWAILVVVGALLGLTASWIADAFGGYSLRYRLTLEAMVEGRPVTGSGVIQVDYSKRPPLLPQVERVMYSVHGEAVVLDLGDRGVLFALLKDGSLRTGRDSPRRGEPRMIVPVAWWDRGIRGPEDVDRLGQLQGRRELGFDALPMLVRFENLNDPASVKLVEPVDLAASFGPGVTLSRVTVEITRDPVTTAIEQRLPWLRKVASERGTLIPRPRYDVNDPKPIQQLSPIERVRPLDFFTARLDKSK